MGGRDGETKEINTDKMTNLTKVSESVTVESKELTKAQSNFLEYCKEFGWGTLEVKVKDGQPVMVVDIRRETKLD